MLLCHRCGARGAAAVAGDAQGPHGHLWSGLSFLQHGRDSHQPHLRGSVAVQYFSLCSRSALFPAACVLPFPGLGMRKNGYSGNKDKFISSALTALVSAKAASHCTELETRALAKGGQRFCGFDLVSGWGFSNGKDKEPGKADTESNPRQTEVTVFREGSAREIQSIPILK